MHELDTVLSTEDAYSLLEIILIDAHNKNAIEKHYEGKNARIIDSLVVELQLDPEQKFKKGAADATSDFKKFMEDLDKYGKDINKGTKETAEGFGIVTKKVAELAAAYLGFAAIKSFVNDVVQQNTALINMSATLGVSIDKLSTLNNVARMFGSSAQGMAGAIGSIQQQLVMMNAFHMPPSQEFLIGATMLGMPQSAFLGRNVTPDSFILSAARAAQGQLRSGTSQAVVSQELQRLGITDPGMIAMMSQRSPEEILRYMEEMKKLAPSGSDIKAVQDFNVETGRMSAMFGKLAADIGGNLLPALEPFIRFIEKLVGLLDETVTGKNDSGIPPAQPGTFMYWFDRQHWFQRGWNALTGQGGGSGSNAPGTGHGGGDVPAGHVADGNLPIGRANVRAQNAQQLREAGLPESAVAALQANVTRESGFNPSSRVADQPHFGGEAHYAHGLYQEGGTEWNNYSSWLDKNYPGRSWTDPRLQTEFLMQNLKRNYPRVWANLMDPNRSAAQKAMDFQGGYLKPAVPHTGDMGVAERYLRNPPGAPTAASEGGATASTVPLPQPRPAAPWYSRMWHSMWGGEDGDGAALPKSAVPRMYHGATLHNQTNNTTTNNVSSAETHIGYITVNTQATDARGIATELGPMLKNRVAAMGANNISGGPV